MEHALLWQPSTMLLPKMFTVTINHYNSTSKRDIYNPPGTLQLIGETTTLRCRRNHQITASQQQRQTKQTSQSD